MDYPKSVPSVGLVGGKFVDENPLTGTPGSLIPAQWGNAVSEEILNVIIAAGLVPDEFLNTQLSSAIATIVGTTRPLASQLEAEAGTDNAKTMTALRTQQAISKRAAIVGASRNVRISIPVASATATVTADEVFVKSSLGGSAWLVPSLNRVINLATTGAGAMDTGTAPVNGYVAIYVILNAATQVPALLASNATTTKAPEVYGGANMPAGYTSSALLAVLPTNGSGQFKVAYVLDRNTIISEVSVLSGSGGATNVLLDLSLAVPKNAVLVSGSLSATATSGSGGVSTTISSTASGLGGQTIAGYSAGASGCNCPFKDLLITTPQTAWYSVGLAGPGTGAFNIFVKGYSI